MRPLKTCGRPKTTYSVPTLYFFKALSAGLEAEDMSLHLYKRHVAREFTDGIEPAAVDMLVGIVFQQVTKGLDAQLVAEHFPAVRAYARQILYVLLEDIH